MVDGTGKTDDVRCWSGTEIPMCREKRECGYFFILFIFPIRPLDLSAQIILINFSVQRPFTHTQ